MDNSSDDIEDNNPLQTPLIESENDVFTNLDNISMNLMKTQKQIDDIKELFSTNPSQNEFFQAQAHLENQINDISEYESQYSNNKNAFALFSSVSSVNKAKFLKFSQKIDEMFGNLQKKTTELSDLMKKIKIAKNYQEIDNKPMSSSSSSPPLENKLMAKNVIDQKEFLNKRGKALRNAKIVSGQLNAMSKDLNQEVNIQGEKLNQIEENIISVKDSVKKAEDTIEDANAENRQKNKRLLIMILIIVFVLIAVVAIVLTMVLK